MSTQVNLGDTVQFEGRDWRVIRIIHEDWSLFESTDEVYTLKEAYYMIKDRNGSIDFVMLTSEKHPYTGPSSPIKSLEPLAWRRTL